MKYKLQCQSKTRQSNYTVQCNGVGIVCKNGNIRCKNHAGKSTGPISTVGKSKSAQNIKNYNDKRNSINNNIKNKTTQFTDDWNSFVKMLQRKGDA